LALLAAVAEQAGHEAVIIDGETERIGEDEMLNQALNLKADVFAFTNYSPFFHLNAKLARRLKESGDRTPILAGGPHITICREKAFLPQFDFLFTGEAEQSLPQFLKLHADGGDLSQVPGIIFRKNGDLVSRPPEWIASNMGAQPNYAEQRFPLDKLPFPAWHLLPMAKYRVGTKNGKVRFAPIQSMRGCPWRCIFCHSKQLNSGRLCRRSPESVVTEMKKVKREYPEISHFFFNDDVMTLWSDQHIVKICDLMDKESLKVTFEGNARANMVSDELVARMARSGLVRLSFGLEAVDLQIRETMKKKVPLEAYVKANEICGRHGVEAINSVMIGLPGETRETISAMLDWLGKQRAVLQVNFAIAIPYPGTEFHEMAMTGRGVELLTTDFSKYIRYGSAVTRIGDLEPEDLIDLQNDGFIEIYSKPWRWGATYRRHGALGFVLLAIRLMKSIRKKLFKKSRPIFVHPKG
jgi:radical SAM superfamily enzyme YgiQ (UPF0313 family)